jgi:hypothetical protein
VLLKARFREHVKFKPGGLHIAFAFWVAPVNVCVSNAFIVFAVQTFNNNVVHSRLVILTAAADKKSHILFGVWATSSTVGSFSRSLIAESTVSHYNPEVY